MTVVPPAGRVLVSRPGAPWLPPGGRADVVLAEARSALPEPACVVRLVATRGPRVLTVERPDGRGLDIPTRQVGGGSVEAVLDGLLGEVVGGPCPTDLLGWVHNVVPVPTDAYPWPTPDAHFVVWHCDLPGEARPDGVWLDAADAEAALGERHWWPLAAHVPALATTGPGRAC